MKITKFPQSCILVETKGKKILIDPSTTKYDEKYLDIWKTADAVLITHRHSDHIHAEVLNSLDIPIYSTSEVSEYFPNLKVQIIKVDDILDFVDLKVEVVKAIHGFVMPKGEILENIGFILDDGDTRLWITSDTIRFKNNYKADVLFANITAFDASMNLWGAGVTYAEAEARLLIVAHQDTGKMMYDKAQIKSYLDSQNINYIIPEILDVFEI